MGLDYTLDCFIYGSGCLLLSEACIAASLLKHFEILDATGQGTTQFLGKLYIYFASILLRITEHLAKLGIFFTIQ